MIIKVVTVKFLETVRNEFTIMCDFVDEHSKALNTLLNQLQRYNSHSLLPHRHISTVTRRLQFNRSVIT